MPGVYTKLKFQAARWETSCTQSMGYNTKEGIASGEEKEGRVEKKKKTSLVLSNEA